MWPSQGRVEFEGVTTAYNSGTVAVRDFSLTIRPGQKVTICGRTGNGKSSLLLTLLRLLDLQSDTIRLDGVDITQIPRDFLRQRCFVTVSQDGLLMSNETIFNLCRGVLKAEALRARGGRPVVLLDEVTSAFDAAAEVAVHRVVESEFSATGHTVVVVSHRLGHLAECARLASDVVVRMRDGMLEGVWSDVRGLVVNGDEELRR
ncbi:hypothetical protein VTG60DRAFT_4150 [Thermothelomyces hinnuleus]